MTAPTPEEVAAMVAAKLEFAVTLRQRGRNHDAEVEVQEAEFIRAVQAAREAAERVCETYCAVVEADRASRAAYRDGGLEDPHYRVAETAAVEALAAFDAALDAWRAARAQGGENE